MHGGQYDYMGAGDSFPTETPLRDKTGEDIGITVTGVYRIKPQRMILEGFNRDEAPPYWWAAAMQGKPIPAEAPPEDAPRDIGAQIGDTAKDVAETDIWTKVVLVVAIIAFAACFYWWTQKGKPKTQPQED